MRRKKLRRLFDANLAWDRTHRLVETLYRLLGLEHVDDAEPVLAFSCHMEEETLEGKVGWRLETALAVRQPAHDLLVPLPRQARDLMKRHDEHLDLLGAVARQDDSTYETIRSTHSAR